MYFENYFTFQSKNYYRIFSVFSMLMIVLFCVSCKNTSALPHKPNADTTLVMKYSDFGSPGMAKKILGLYRWQWSFVNNPDELLNIKVVVYRGVTLEYVKNRYPVDPNNLNDYRYVEYSMAMKWLKKQIKKINSALSVGDTDDVSLSSLKVLYETALKIEGNLRWVRLFFSDVYLSTQ